MSVTKDIVAGWRSPRAVIARHYARPQSEPYAFTFLVTFIVVTFIARWPVAGRESFYQPDVPLAQRLLANGLGLLALIPFWYLLAALSTWVTRVSGRQISYYDGRLALFWALVMVTPLVLLQGLVEGMIGPSPGLSAVSIITGAAFLFFWIINLLQAGR